MRRMRPEGSNATGFATSIDLAQTHKRARDLAANAFPRTTGDPHNSANAVERELGIDTSGGRAS